MATYTPFLPVNSLFAQEQGGPIRLRQEQEQAVKMAKKQFGKTDTQGVFTPYPAHRKFLWNAKMRFGKTLCAMELVRQMDVQRVLIVTHRPVVDQEWEDNFKKIFTAASGLDLHYDYGRKSVGAKQQYGNFYNLEEFVRHDRRNHYVFFASMQYLRRSSLVTGREDEDENELKKRILRNDWDLVIIDEAHEGTRTALGQQVINLLKKERTKMLHLSGTPFNLYEDFSNGEIYTWDYIQEQQAKRAWAEKHPLEHNPYAELPQMKILTFDLSKLINNFVAAGGEFKFSEFFRTWTGNPRADHAAMPEGMKGRFVHEDAVVQFLDKLCEESETSNYPFSRQNYRDTFNHTLWIVPGVKEAKALKALLEQHAIFSNFRVINVAGNGGDDEQREDALDKVKEAIEQDPEGGYTITISCGRLTTGVTVRQWTAVFYLKGSEMTSASTYMQTIFRVQSPWVVKDKDGRVTKMKQECYVFDFAPQRTLKMVAETAKFSSHAKKNQKRKNADGEEMTQDEKDKQTMREFLELCPVLSLDGGVMTPFDENRLFGQLNSVYIDRLVLSGFDDNCLYDQDELMKMDAEALNALGKKIGEVSNMKKPSKSTKNSDLLMNQLTPEQRRLIAEAKKKAEANKKNGKKADDNLTPEELAALEAEREARKQAREERLRRISNIRGISLRIPLLMYGGADAGDTSIDLTTENFTRKISDASWVEFMPKGVTKADFNAIRRCFNATRFEEAGKRYRALAREADEMNVEDRIHRIAEIFDCFKNPDKETVLTPWRVVNMHMSDTLGGYCFWNERFDGPNEKWLDNPTNGQLFESVPTHEPRYVDRGEVTQEVFGSFENTRILEINSKTGLYPLYVAYQLFRTRMPDYLAAHCIEPDNVSPEDEQVVWDDVLANCVYVICNTPMAKLITKRTLCGFREVERVNVKDKNIVDAVLNDEDKVELAKEITRVGFWEGTRNKEQMNFNAVVGNPPYQKKTEDTSDTPIYNHFMEIGLEVAPIFSFITPARFLFNAGKTPKEFNEKMLNDEHFKVVTYEADSSKIFPNVDIKGGIAITMRDTNKIFGKMYTFTSHDELKGILGKVMARDDFQSIDSLIVLQNKFDLDKLYADHPEYKQIIGSNGREKRLTTSIFNSIDAFTNVKVSDDDANIIGLINNNRTYRFIPQKYLDNHENLNKYKVILPKSNGSGALGEVLSTPLIGEPLIGYTQSFIGIGSFDTFEEAEGAIKYIKSKFSRVMLGILKVTQDNNTDVWAYVPLQDFTSSSDIDWSQSICDIDRQLYRKYGLTDEEVDFIERMIKPME